MFEQSLTMEENFLFHTGDLLLKIEKKSDKLLQMTDTFQHTENVQLNMQFFGLQKL